MTPGLTLERKRRLRSSPGAERERDGCKQARGRCGPACTGCRSACRSCMRVMPARVPAGGPQGRARAVLACGARLLPISLSAWHIRGTLLHAVAYRYAYRARICVCWAWACGTRRSLGCPGNFSVESLFYWSATCAIGSLGCPSHHLSVTSVPSALV